MEMDQQKTSLQKWTMHAPQHTCQGFGRRGCFSTLPHSWGGVDPDVSPLLPLHRGPPRSSSSDPDFVVVDGVPVMLPTYDEAVNGSSSALGPGYLASVGQGCPLPVDDQSPPAYPGSGDTDTGPGESETCDSTSGSSEMLQSLYSPPMCQGGNRPAPDTPDTISSTAGEVASTSPGIDIADGKHFQSHG